ncbi:right-handed parallel beta-helix repeat-containing protein [Firmicutes bacterium AM55-24TS]|jgi:hypothetical protein|nr:right-handed parallel beta-helix repeat-containing protein [Firmicutes bacterium AM55-24TS]
MDGQKIFVSTVGDDSGDGSEEEPLRTLEKAIDVANEMREDSDKLIEILLREGTYSVTNTIKIINSQKDDPLLKISAYQDEKVTINAGVDIPLSAMSIADSDFTNAIIDKPNAGSVLQYNLKDAQIEDLGEISLRGHLISDEKEAQAELSLNGEVQKLAGWPNGEYTGLIKPTDSNEYGKRTKSGIANGCSFQVNYDRPSQWSKPEQAWLSGTIGPNYEFDYYPVSRFDSEEKRVYLSRGALEKYYTEPYYRFENVPEELDEPGEYYIDRQSGMLYFYPPEDTPKDSVLTITMSTPTLDVSGKAPNSMFRIENSKNIVFENLIFKGGRGSAITGKNNSNIQFINCEINSFGENGIRFDASTDIKISDCKIHDVGQDGILFVSCGNYKTLSPSNIVVSNNDIYNFARLERSYKTGIDFGYRCVGATAANNHIHNGPHAGMIFYGVNNDIYGNEFDNLVTEFSDMDALYCNNSNYPWERGNKIHNNYFHDIGKSSMNGRHQINVRAIRTDNRGCGLNIYENLFYNIGDGGNGNGNNGIGAITAEGTRNRIFNNLFVDCNEAYFNTLQYKEIETADDGTLYPDTIINSSGVEVANTINGAKVADLKKQMENYLPVYGKQFPELYNYFYEHPNMSKTNEFKNNMIINIAIPLSNFNGTQNEEGFRGSQMLTAASGNYVSTSDPGFVSYDNGNLELSSSATLLVEGLPKFEMSSFGIQ